MQGMEPLTREQAEAIYDAGKERVVEVLLTMSEHIARLSKLEQRVIELERQLKANSQNSSKPPSSDGYNKPAPKSLRKKSGRRSGGQTGHGGHTLAMVLEPDHVTEHWPTTCGRCGKRLVKQSSCGYEVRQVHDLPPIRIEVSEHRGMQVSCPCCSAVTRGDFPAGIKPGAQYGSGVASLATYMLVYQHLPLERCQEFFTDALGCGLSDGTLVNIQSRCAKHLAPITTAIKAAISRAPVVHFDETGLRVQGRLWWLHSASTDLLTHYAADAKRGCEAMNRINILPDYVGVAVHDALSSYGKYAGAHALCNAHVLRELTAAEESLVEAIWPTRLKALLVQMKDEVDAAKQRGRKGLSQKRLRRLERRYDSAVSQGLFFTTRPDRQPGQRGRSQAAPERNLVERLRDRKADILRFLHDFRVPFDNNLAERDLRMAKVKQKVSGCFRSEQGVHVFAAVRGYVSTVRKQGHSVLNALRALFDGRPVQLQLA